MVSESTKQMLKDVFGIEVEELVENRQFRIQVWHDNRWVDGNNVYDTLEAAETRLNRLDEVGIVARIKPATEN